MARYDRDWDDAPTVWTFIKWFMIIFAAVFVMGIISTACGLFGGAIDNGAKLIQQEFYPTELLKKYEWFKDAAAALDKKAADIGVYNTRLENLAADYKGIPRSKWPRDDREQSSIWQSELAGIKASYNQLAAEYNAEMVKFNKAIANVGPPPQGGKLPQYYKPYLEQ